MQGVGFRLQQYLDDSTDVQFNWQSSHCLHFAAGWMLREEGLAQPFSGNLKADVSLMHELGIERCVSDALGRQPVPIGRAKIGDVVLMHLRKKGRFAIGICAGDPAAFLHPFKGFIMAPTMFCHSAWPLIANQ